MPDPPKIFVSYSHRDKRWLNALRVHLKPLQREGVIDLWADDEIKAGARWKEEVQQALAEAKVAILLISADFMASDFIIEEELQPLLVKKAEEQGLHIFPLIVSDCLFLEMESLRQFQAVNDPARPLDKMKKADRQTVFKDLAKAVKQALQPAPAQEEPASAVQQAEPAAQKPSPQDKPPEQLSRLQKERTDSPAKARKRKKKAQAKPSTPSSRSQKVKTDSPSKTRKRKKTAPSPPPAQPRKTPPQTWQNALGMPFARIPAGTFAMGSEENDDEKPVHPVTISRSFYLGTTVVTQGQWKAVMGTEPWKGIWKVRTYVKEGDDYPAVYVTWGDTQAFIEKLNARDDESLYRLPTEAEWEYACRAGSTTAYSFGDDASELGDYAWYDANARYVGEQYAHQVGQKRSNAWGLYDMHGNVWEWVADWYDYYYYHDSPETDPPGPAADSDRVFRGGSFFDPTWDAWSASRGIDARGYRGVIGFRLVRMAL